MKKRMLTICAALIALSYIASAQKLALEKTYEITGKSKRGYLDEVVYDPATKQTLLSFVTRVAGNFTGSKTKVKYQNYYFDKDFNFVNMEEKEDVYRNKKYKGDDYTVEGISVQNNLTGTFVIRKKLVTYTWDWFFGGYKKKVKLLDKVKPKDDSGNKYILLRKFENDQNGDVVVMVVPKGKGAKPNEYVILKIDNQLNFEVTDRFEFASPQVIAASYLISNIDNMEQDDSGLDEENEGNEADDTDDQGDLSTSDIGMVFAPSSGGKKAKASMYDYTFVHVGNNGKIVRKVEMKALASAWAINQMIQSGNDIYMMGPANDGKYIDLAIPGIGAPTPPTDGIKWKLFQLAKIAGNKVEYLTTTDLDEFEAKLKQPPSQSKTPSYRGKRFHFTTAGLGNDGSIIVCGQNYERKKQNNVQVKSYRDVVTFYFDPAGKLKAQYGVRREENNKYARMAPTTQMLNKGKSTVYWTVMEMDGIRTEREGKVKAVKALLYPSVARIDAATGEISDFVQFGTVDGKPQYYLHNGNPILPMSEENAMVFLGVDKPGKTLWFGKINLD
jgi:hypothetical protein